MISLLQVLLGPDVVRSEVAVPRLAGSIDALIRVGEPSDLWGPLGERLARRMVVLEHESRPPSRRKLYSALAKLSWVVGQRWKPIGDSAERYPVLLFVSAGCPRWVSSGEVGLVQSDVGGVYEMHWSLPTDVLFVNLRGLADAPGLSLLQLMPTPRTVAEAERSLTRLKRDSGMLQSTKDKVLEAIMNKQIPATPREQWISAESLRQEGRQEGRREGILGLASRVLEARQVEALETIEDLDELERRVYELMAKH